MKAMVSVWVEAAWCDGTLQTQQDQMALALSVVSYLEEKYPNRGLSYCRSFCEIHKDIAETLLKLSYGGRKPADVSAVRMSWVRGWLQQNPLPQSFRQFIFNDRAKKAA